MLERSGYAEDRHRTQSYVASDMLYASKCQKNLVSLFSREMSLQVFVGCVGLNALPQVPCVSAASEEVGCILMPQNRLALLFSPAASSALKATV